MFSYARALTSNDVDKILISDKSWIIFGHVQDNLKDDTVDWLESLIKKLIFEYEQREIFPCLEKDINFIVSNTAYKIHKGTFTYDIEIIAPSLRDCSPLFLYFKRRNLSPGIIKGAGLALLAGLVSFGAYYCSLKCISNKMENKKI